MSNKPFKKEEFKSTADVVSEELGSSSDKPDYFSLRATIVYIKGTGLSYPACPGEKCAKKMAQEDDEVWRCEKCDKTYPAPEHRFVLFGPSPRLGTIIDMTHRSDIS